MADSKIQVKSELYSSNGYDTSDRMQSYLMQIKEILAINPKNMLEIGIGNGFLSDYLKKKIFNVTTCDIDEKLNPDKMGSVLSLPFADNSFDLVVCFQVLEHLPYSDFTRALSEIKRVTNQLSIISLPDTERCYSLSIAKNSSSYFRKYITIPRKRNPEHIFDGEHYWEIGKHGYPLGRICCDINKIELAIIRSYKFFNNSYHRIFILSKDFKMNCPVLWYRCRIGNFESWRDFYYEENLTPSKLFLIFRVLKKMFFNHYVKK